MTMSAKCGSFNKPTSTGSQNVTGVGFQPKALIIWSGYSTTEDTWDAHTDYSMGFYDGTTQRSVNVGDLDAASPNSFAERNYSSHIIEMIQNLNGSTNTLGKADATAFISDGFTLNWTTTDANAYKMYYLALGGADITNVAVGSFTCNTSTGNQSVSGLGFQPDFEFFMKASQTTLDTHASSGDFNFGFAKSSSQRGSISEAAKSGQATSTVHRYQRADRCMVQLDPVSNTGAIKSEWDFVSQDAGGFTLNQVTAGAADNMIYMAIKGGNYKVGTITPPTTNTSQVTSGVGFTPAAAMFLTIGLASVTTTQANGRISIGAADSTTSRHVASTGDTDGLSTPSCKCYVSSGGVLNYGTGSSLLLSADYTSVSSDGFTLLYSNNDATANREVIYAAFGPGINPVTPATFYMDAAYFVADK